MLAKSENRLLTINGKVIERKVNTLTFEMRGTQFPNFDTIPGTPAFVIQGTAAGSIMFNYGDGVSETVNLVNSSGSYGVAFTPDGLGNAVASIPAQARPPHVYTDGNSGKRVVSLTFSNINTISLIRTSIVLIEGAISSDINYLTNLYRLNLSGAKGITNFPSDLRLLKNLRILELSNITPVISNKIPDTFFDLSLTTFSASSTYNLSDLVGSNLFKINQWANLTTLQLEACKISVFDETFRELNKLTDLRFTGNLLPTLPAAIEDFSKLYRLYAQASSVNSDLLNFDKLKDLTVLALYGDYNFSDLSIKWRNLYSLSSILNFNYFCSQIKYNQFIDQFYDLCTTNGNLTANASPAPYINRFRNISWGYSTYVFTGAKVAPSGYIQGVSNGTPINQGQKVYVLQNQYNHTITHA